MVPSVDAADLAVRHDVYNALADTGRAPSAAVLCERHGDDVPQRLERLAEAHMLVLDEGEVRMALPFSAIPTPHVVRSGDRSWWANCAWDAIAIPLLLGVDAEIEAAWLDDETPYRGVVEGSTLHGPAGFVHFQRPAVQWWDDIVET